MTAPFRDSTEAQVAALRDRVEALDLEVKTLARKPEVKAPSKPSHTTVSQAVYALAGNIALWWALAWGCHHFGAPESLMWLSGLTGGVVFFSSAAILVARAPS